MLVTVSLCIWFLYVGGLLLLILGFAFGFWAHCFVFRVGCLAGFCFIWNVWLVGFI